MTGSFAQLRMVACVTRYSIERATHGLWCVSVCALGRGGPGKDRTIVPEQLLRQRFTCYHQGQMFCLAIATGRRGHKVRIWCGGLDRT